MISTDYASQLLSTYPELISFRGEPSSTSLLSSEQSLLLYTRVEGNDEYRAKLTELASVILDELIGIADPATAAVIGRYRGVHHHHLELILHTQAQVASRFPELKVIAFSRTNDDYVRGHHFGELKRKVIYRLTSLLTGHDGREFTGEAIPGAYFRGMPGYYNRITRQGVRSRLEASDALNDRLVRAGLVFRGHPYENRQPFNPSAPVVFLDGQPLNSQLLEEEHVIPWLNERLASTRVTLQLPDFASFQRGTSFGRARDRLNLHQTQLTRNFKYDERSGGRLYGNAVQRIPKGLRKWLLLDGEPTCEWDYKCMEPNLAYSIAGSTCPDEDAYRVPGYVPKDTRDLFKLLCVAAFGADEHTNPISVFSNLVYEETGSWLEPGTASRMDRDFWRHHHKIQSFRGTSAWRQLQYEESQVCLRVLNSLKEQGIVCIPIHDSVLVKRQHEAPLKEAMTMAVAGLSSPPRIKANH